MVVSDVRGVMLHVNPVAERTFGYSRGELVGKNITVLIPPSLVPAHDAAMQKYLSKPANGSTINGHSALNRPRSVRGLRKDGTQVSVVIRIAGTNTGGERTFTATIDDAVDGSSPMPLTRSRSGSALTDKDRNNTAQFASQASAYALSCECACARAYLFVCVRSECACMISL